MSIIESLKNLEAAVAELKIALQSEQVISSPESVTNQEELSTEELLAMSSIRL
jgi:hypothetical protein